MKIKIKKLDENAVIPSYAKIGDAGLDLIAVSKNLVKSGGGEFIEYGTGLAVEIPEGHVGQNEFEFYFTFVSVGANF